MTGIGLVLLLIGYSAIYWGVNSIQGGSQGSFVSYIFPFGQ